MFFSGLNMRVVIVYSNPKKVKGFYCARPVATVLRSSSLCDILEPGSTSQRLHTSLFSGLKKFFQDPACLLNCIFKVFLHHHSLSCSESPGVSSLVTSVGAV